MNVDAFLQISYRKNLFQFIAFFTNNPQLWDDVFRSATKMSRNFPNLAKDLVVDAAEQLWVSDTTGIPVYDGFGYLTLTTDSYSKLIVGYNLQRTKDSSGSIKTLRMALNQREHI